MGDLNTIFEIQFSMLVLWVVRSSYDDKGDYHGTFLMISQHSFKYWLSAVRQQAITRANVDPVECRHLGSPSHNASILLLKKHRLKLSKKTCINMISKTVVKSIYVWTNDLLVHHSIYTSPYKVLFIHRIIHLVILHSITSSYISSNTSYQHRMLLA